MRQPSLLVLDPLALAQPDLGLQLKFKKTPEIGKVFLDGGMRMRYVISKYLSVELSLGLVVAFEQLR
jgi:uncharacterized protein involved in copper resistance